MALSAGNVPVVGSPLASPTVDVSWAPTTAGAPVAGYQIRAFDATTGAARPVGGGCAGIVSGTSCTETGVPDGTWRYSVTARQGLWSGAESARSAAVAVDSSDRTLVLSHGPVAYWRLGESSGTTAYDETGVSNGTYAGGYTLGSPGALVNGPDTAVDLDGASGRVNVPSVAGLELTNQVSIEAWVNLDSTAGTQWIVDKGAFYYLYIIDGQVVFGVQNEGGYPYVNAPVGPAGVWQHWVGTYDGANLSLYRNGVLAAQSPLTGTFLSSADSLTIGAFDPLSSGQTVDGRVDEVAVYGSGLTGAQVRSHYDRAHPVAITFPVAAAGYGDASWDAGCSTGICGTTSAERGIESVAVSVREGSGNYWNGTAFASATEVLLPATGTTSWSLPFPAANFPAEGAYTVRAVATGPSGSTFAGSTGFTVDRTAPSASIFMPAAGGTYSDGAWNGGCNFSMCGLQSDAGTDVASVGLSLRQGTGNYWDGTAFASPTEVLVPTTVIPLYWYLPFPGATFPAEGSYTARTVATDAAGNSSTTSATFVIDRTAPAVTITFPTASAYTGPAWNAGCTSGICGTASDVNGIAGSAVSIRRVSTGRYWDGTSFASAAEVMVAAAGTTSWSLPFAAVNFPADGSYTVRAAATGSDGLTGSTSTTFTIDRTAPTVVVTFPAAGGRYATASWNAGCTSKICGTAADAGSGVASTRVSVRRGSGNYWNGTSFGSSTEVLITATGTTSWSLPFPASNMTADGAYTVRALTTDNVGNTATASNTFTRDTVRPSPTGSALSNANGFVTPGTDELKVTFNEALDVSTICSGWSGTGNQSLGGSGVVVTFTNGGTTDTLSVSAPGCTLGTLTTGNYVGTTSTFSGNTVATESRVTWTAATRVLTIHIGARVTGTNSSTSVAAGNVTYAPSAAFKDLAGNAVTTAGVVTAGQRF